MGTYPTCIAASSVVFDKPNLAILVPKARIGLEIVSSPLKVSGCSTSVLRECLERVSRESVLNEFPESGISSTIEFVSSANPANQLFVNPLWH